MHNETLMAYAAFAPIWTAALLIWWAEKSKEILVYLLAVVVLITAIVTLEPELGESFRFMLVAVTVLIVWRGYLSWEGNNGSED